MRQELFSLKKLLNDTDEILLIDRQYIALNDDLVDVSPPADADFLDQFNFPGETKFDQWVSEFRRNLLAKNLPEGRALRAVIEIVRESCETTLMSSSIALALESALSENLVDAGGFTTVHRSHGTIELPVDIELRLRVFTLGQELRISIALEAPGIGSVAAPMNRRMSVDYAENANLPVLVDQIANEAADYLLHTILQNDGRLDSQSFVAAKQAALGIRALFSRSVDGLSTAEKAMNQAIELSDSPSFLAWRGYLGALRLEEHDEIQHADIRRDAQQDIERALANGPENGLVSALASQVYGFVLNNFDMAGKCLQSAVRTRPGHVMTQDALALYSFYTGDVLAARKAAQKSEYFGRHLPFQYCFSTSMLMVETLSRNFRAGIHHGERALALTPTTGTQDYPPTLRYLGICYVQTEQFDKARDVFRKLDEQEGRLTQASLLNGQYLMPSESSRDLLLDSLQKLGR